MQLKKFLSVLFTILLTSQSGYSQIIDDVGDGWKNKVEQALQVIKTYDVEKYYFIQKHCTKVGYWLGEFATIEPPHTILVPVSEMKKGCINDIAAVLVHESLHLYYRYPETSIKLEEEEFKAYSYEYDFLMKIPNVQYWLIQHCVKMLEIYKIK